MEQIYTKMSLEDTNRPPVLYHVWFRHTGMDPPGEDCWEQEPRLYSLDGIKRQIEGHTLTHLVMKDNILPDIHLLAPHLTHVAIQLMSKEESNCSRFANVSQLVQLERLVLNHNDFSSDGLPDIFSSLTSLRELCLNYCKLTTLPSSMSKLIKLEKLKMYDNNFSSVGLPEIFSSMTSLRELDLSSCKLTTLPSSMSKLIKLEELCVTGNDFSSHGLPEIFSSMTSLRVLNLSSCKLTTLSLSMSKLINLEKLYITDSDFSSVGVPEIFSSMTSLSELYLCRCRLTTLPLSMSKLVKLEELGISDNDFSSHGLPDIFNFMTLLRELYLYKCELTTLPLSMKHLKVLQSLDLSDNHFTSLPSCVFEMRNLSTLDIRRNRSLTHLDPEILQLTELKKITTIGCYVVTTPPHEVFKHGLNAIRQYYTDLAKGAGLNLPFVTIAVIGKTNAGKTSLIRTLQSSDKKRVLTNRAPDVRVDETTKVFNVEEVTVNDTVLRLIDMGGQSIYHITYQLTLKQHCIPVIVVSMKQYKKVSDESNEREAVRRLSFDWLSHLYLANPTLGPPKLILTHKDTFDSSEFADAKLNFLKISDEMCKEIVEEEKQLGGEFCKIQHFSDSSTPMFLPEDIYEVGKDDTYSVFDDMKINLLLSSQSFLKPLPKIWDDVNECIMSLNTAYNSLDELVDILHEIDGSIEENQLKIILRYMHACGKVLWYEDIETLQPYIFHKITEVTKLLCVLYNHDADAWSMKLEHYIPYLELDGTIVEKEHCQVLVSKLLTTGVLDENLLHYLIRTEISFKSVTAQQLAVVLFQSFRLLHGPLSLQSLNSSFIIPFFATGYHDILQLDTEEENFTLQVEVTFKGLALPRYVYHQMGVGVLDMFPSDRASVSVKSNGVQVFHDNFGIQLIHNYKSRKATIKVSSKVENVCDSWDKLIKVTNSAVEHVLYAWPAARPVCVCVCAHCLLAGNPNPERTTNPDWCICSLKIKQERFDIQNGSQMVICSNKKILSPLKFPCTALTETEIERLKKLVVQLKLGRKTSTQSSEDAQNASDEREAQQADYSADDLSDLSEDDEYLYPVDDVTRSMVFMRLRVKPTTSSKIKELFSNTDKIFEMTPVRGRFLIINNKNFLNRPDACRHGSDADVKNMSHMLNAFNFKVIVHSDLQAQDMLSVIKREVELEDHIDHGMFGLLIMSHGTKSNCIYGTDMKMVHLTSVYDLMTPLNFPSMKDKPKLIILEACCGDRIDVGEKGVHQLDEARGATKMVSEVVQPPSSQIGQPQQADKMTGLNYDDLFVIKSSFESFIAKIHPVYGSLMIRALVSTMCTHACHHDVYDIFKAVQSKVRKLCIDRELDCGQIPVAQDTLTHMRKLYLFPGYNGPVATAAASSIYRDTQTPNNPGCSFLPALVHQSGFALEREPNLSTGPITTPAVLPEHGPRLESESTSENEQRSSKKRHYPDP